MILTPDKVWYDIATPYGYGGPLIENLTNQSNKGELVSAYEQAFQEYTKKNDIVSEFIRFHPIIKNAEDFKTVYELKVDRKTFGTDLTNVDPFLHDFSKSARKEIRKLTKNYPLYFEYDEHPKHLEDFIEIYYSTMSRNVASDEYYFDDDYFCRIIRYFPDNLITVKVFLEEKLIGMGLYFRYGNYLHAHLSGTLNEYLKYSPAYILKQAFVEYGVSHGYKLIHYGGGKTSAVDDSLAKFKQKFGRSTTFNFITGKRIWNDKIYKKLNEFVGIEELGDFFPAYRQPNYK
ncbi:GNAT family N-acetyltransferase [Enterococcus devriesei]|uniref:GNAT family N-acetyltransferase n=1 Tax=Enterococcus devriesei TaxID=319970 RepID=UPI0036D2DD17